jgi:exonuclease VII small subunit
MSTKNNQTIRQKTEALNALVAWFDSDEFELEQALGKFKDAERLAAEIEKDLLALKNEVNVLRQKFDETA